MKLQYNIRTNTLHSIEKDTNILQLLDEIERLDKENKELKDKVQKLTSALEKGDK